MRPAQPSHRHWHGTPNDWHGHRPPWMRHGRARPPFGLHRQIYWSLVGSMAVASIATILFIRRWSPQGPSSVWIAVAFGLLVLALLWMASWRLSWRLVAPLNRLVRVVQQLGGGDLSARARFPEHAHDEVARVARAIDTMADRLEQQVNDERQLLAVISHELRTPLARVRVLTALAREGQHDALEQIDREVAEIDDLIAKVLVRSRLMFGTMTTREVSMVAAVREAIERAGLSASLLMTQDGGEPGGDAASFGHDIVHADPTLLHRAIANIIDNAVRHGRGIERVTVRAVDGEVRVEVLDRGPGFVDRDPTIRFTAFAPESGDGRGDGLGLGLHLVSRIVQAHEGRAWAESRPEGGARVGFRLPVTRRTG